MAIDISRRDMSRRSFAKHTGIVSAVSLTGLAGCLGEDEGGNGDYPSDDITWIIPFSQGGGTDVYAREMVQHLPDELGVNLAIENISGAASLRGAGEMMQSQPDGYTVAAYNPPSTPVSEMVTPQDYDLAEATGLGLFASTPFVVVANPEHEIEDYGDLIDRYDNGELSNFSGKERGGVDHVMAKIMQNSHGLNWDQYVGYDGSGPAVEATLSGEVPAAVSTDTAAFSAVEDGGVDLVTVLAEGGSSVFPDEETITDQGYDEIDYIVELSRGMYAPPDTPEEVVEAWEGALETVMTSDEMEQWSEETGNEILFGTGEEAEEVVHEAYDEIPDAIDLDEVREAEQEG
jgi:tripartite-type tricarboxylate transporter receptor subunit TctC